MMCTYLQKHDCINYLVNEGSCSQREHLIFVYFPCDFIFQIFNHIKIAFWAENFSRTELFLWNQLSGSQTVCRGTLVWFRPLEMCPEFSFLVAHPILQSGKSIEFELTFSFHVCWDAIKVVTNHFWEKRVITGKSLNPSTDNQ
jgi:hypothetical protein